MSILRSLGLQAAVEAVLLSGLLKILYLPIMPTAPRTIASTRPALGVSLPHASLLCHRTFLGPGLGVDNPQVLVFLTCPA